MESRAKSLEELVRELPPDLAAEARDFIEFLLGKRVSQKPRTLRQDWAGALRKYRDQYTSVELQHKASDWRDS
jgi:hypothetical protein